MRSSVRSFFIPIAMGAAVAAAIVFGLAGAYGPAGPILPSADQLPTPADMAPAELPGLHNVVAFHEGYYSGSMPHGEVAFKTLAELGVKTIISVDGAIPDVETATKYGMTYIHLPIGYNGFDELRRRELARATRDSFAAGPVYTHCHHGKHRSAGAAGVMAVSLGWASPAEMIERMHVSGTSPKYTGLYACTANATPIDDETLDAVAADFPAVSRPEGMVKAMVELDIVTENLQRIAATGWRVPADHPDLVPAAEAGRMADLFRLTVSDDRVQSKSAEFLAMWRANAADAQRLEDMIVADAPAAQLSAQLNSVLAKCNACHDVYRDKPLHNMHSPWSGADSLLRAVNDE